jgi:hypothetical protein
MLFDSGGYFRTKLLKTMEAAGLIAGLFVTGASVLVFLVGFAASRVALSNFDNARAIPDHPLVSDVDPDPRLLGKSPIAVLRLRNESTIPVFESASARNLNRGVDGSPAQRSRENSGTSESPGIGTGSFVNSKILKSAIQSRF